MRRPVKIAAWILGGAALLALLLLGSVLIVGNTDAGRAAIQRVTYWLTDGRVKVAGLSGSFPQHLRVEKLELRDRLGIWLSAEHIVLDWSPWSYLENRLQVDNLQVAKVTMQRLPQGSSAAGGTDAAIPRIDVSRASIALLQLSPQLAGAQASLVVNASAHLRSVRDMLIDATARRVDNDGEYELHLRFDPKRMDAELKLREPASGPLENILGLPGLGALVASVNLSGMRAAEQLELSLRAGALQGHAKGSFNLNDLTADLEFSFAASAMKPRPDLSWDSATLRGDSHGSIKSPTAQGHLEITRLRLPGDVQAAAFNAEVSADRGEAKLDATLRGLRIPGQQPRLFEDDPLKILASLRLDDPNWPLQLSASHRLLSLRAQAQIGGKFAATVEAHLPNLAPFAAFAGQEIHGSANVTGQLDGFPTAPHVKLDATADLVPGAQIWSAAIGERAKLQASATYQNRALVIEGLKFSGRAVSLTADAAASSDNIKGRWTLDVSDLGSLSSIVTGTLKASGTLDGPSAALNANALLSSTLSVRGSPSGLLTGEVKLRGLPAAPIGTLLVHGSFDEAPLQVDIALERAAQGAPHMVVRQATWKSAHADGDVVMPIGEQRTHGRLGLSVGSLADLQHLLGMDIAGSLSGNVALRPNGQRTGMLVQLDAKDLKFYKVAGNVQVDGEGFTDSFAFNAHLQVPNLSGAAASLQAHGNLNLDGREVSVTTALLNYRGQDLRLLSAARIDFASAVQVDEIKLGAQKAQLDVRGQFAPTLDIHATLHGVEPSLINVFFPDFLATGLIEAHADVQGSVSAPTGEVGLLATGLRRAEDAALGLPLADLRVNAQLRGNTADIDARLDAGTASQLSAVGAVPIAFDGAVDMKVNGKFEIGLINPFLEARGQRATGHVEIDATVTGSVTDPQIGGTVDLTQGTLRDYVRGISLSDVQASIVGSEGTLQIKTFTASAAPGTLSMTGSVGVLQPGLPVDLKITARNAQPIVSKLVTANLDADLSISGKVRERVEIAGKVHLNRTLIGIPNSLPPNVAVLDVRRRGKSTVRVVEKPLVIGLNVEVQAPQQILVQGRGLDAEMGGDLHIGGTTAAPLVNGGFDLQRGSFSLAGTRLNFTEGRIGFNGLGLTNKIDPTLDFTAKTNIAADTTATMHITGYADAPIFDFTSNPIQPQDEIMSLLLFGVPVQSLTPLQLAQIGYALASLGGVGGGSGLNPLVKIQKSLGLDRLNIGAGTTTTTATGTENAGASLEAGRYISKRVYIEARQTTTGTSQIQADVDLAKHLKLQTRLGNGTASVQGTTPENDPGSSIGLIYQFEY
jgi:translocation and assembly module TamB